MTSIDTDFGFDAVFRKSAADLKLRLTRDAERESVPRPARRRGSIAEYSIFAALAVLSLAIFVIGCSALRSESPEIWIHRLMALAIVQSILVAAVSMNLLPIMKRHSLVRIGRNAQRAKLIEPPRAIPPLRMDPVPPTLPAPPKAVVGGQLAGREFLEYDDGSIEIDTLVGRRRFVSLDAAREFVGA